MRKREIVVGASALVVCLWMVEACAPTNVAMMEQTARAHCQSEGKQFVLQSSSTGLATDTISGVCVAAGDSRYQPNVRGAISGREQQVSFYLAVNPDCSSLGIPVVVVKRSPAHGSVRMAQGDTFPGYAADNPRHVCDSKKVPAILVFYTSEKGYVGPDEFDISALYANGETSADTLQINVIASPNQQQKQ